MVFKKSKAGKGKKAKKTSKPRRSQAVVNRALHPIPQRYITKMKYSEQVSTDAQGRYMFNLNSIFDPSRTGVLTGHQPYGFDTLATLYNRYRVISCGYRIQCNWSGNTSSLQPVLVGAMPANEELTILSMAELRENPRAKYISQSSGGDTKTLSGSCYIPSLVGRNKAQYMADDRYQAAVNASPQELAVLNIFTAGSGLDSTSSVAIQVLLEYTVEFFDIKHLAQS